MNFLFSMLPKSKLKLFDRSLVWKSKMEDKMKIFSIPRYTVILFLIVYSLTGYVVARASEQGKLKLENLILEAEERNPEIIAARNRWKGAQEIVEARRALPDPQLSYTYFVESVETRVGPQRHIIGVKQKFPFYGKRDLKAEIAAKKADSLKAAYEAVKQEVTRQVKKQYYDLFYISKIIEITLNEKDILERFERIARTKYETGRGNQQNILKVQVDMSRLKNRLLSLTNQKVTIEAMLNTLLN